MRAATVYNFLLEANLTASIAILLMLLIRRFLRRPLGNRALLFAWLLIAIRLLCPLALPNPVMGELRPAYANDPAIRPIAGQVQIRLEDAGDSAYRWLRARSGDPATYVLARNVDRLMEAVYDGTAAQALVRLYLAGAAVTAGWLLFANLRFRRRLRKGRVEPISGALEAEYRALCRERGVKPVPVYLTDPLPGACLVGVVRPSIALPLTVAPQDAIRVLMHEVCHLRAHDTLWGLLRLLCCTVHWFNPLVWVGARANRTDCELACDDRVVKPLDPGQKLAYANVLVQAAAKRGTPGMGVLATGMTLPSKRLRMRVNAILHGPSVRRGLMIPFLLVACVLLAGAFATAETEAPPVVPTAYAAFPERAVTSEADAIAYAQQVWAQDGVAWNTEGIEWSLFGHENGLYYVDGNFPERGTSLSLQINEATGHINYLYNSDSRFDYAMDSSPILKNNPALEDALHDAALLFAAALNPSTQTPIREVKLIDATRTDGAVFVSFQLLTDSKKLYTLLEFEVQPECRVVYYDETAPFDDGSGVG